VFARLNQLTSKFDDAPPVTDFPVSHKSMEMALLCHLPEADRNYLKSVFKKAVEIGEEIRTKNVELRGKLQKQSFLLLH
jgi:hypothetical protein